MSLRRPIGYALTLICAALSVACSSDPVTMNGPEPGLDFPGEGIGKTDVFGRSLVGPADEYPADFSLSAEEEALRSNMAARRQLGWQIAERVLAPVPLVGLAERTPDRPLELTGDVPTIPRWQSWYGVDDIKRIFRRLYGDLGPERRVSLDTFTDEMMNDAFIWNASAVDRSKRWPLERYFKHVQRLDTCDDDGDSAECARRLQSSFSGAAYGNARMVYSPSTVRHLLRNYGAQVECLEILDRLPVEFNEESETNFSVCFDSEFPADSVLIKAHWIRADFNRTVPVYDTDADALRRVIGDGKSADWAEGDRQATPSPSEIFTVRLRNGDTYRLAGLHIMTKELRHWVWVTLWWSDRPDEDFGADRPTSLVDGTHPVWNNYKMAVVVDYTEGDPDPAARFSEYPSLAAALSVQSGGTTWASNPYIEHGRGNARTNCIGCHQHGGSTVGFDLDDDGRLDRLEPELIIANNALFPENGRTQIRTAFPSDYLWSTQRVDNLRQVFLREVRHFSRVDANTPELRAKEIITETGNPAAGAAIFADNCTSCHGQDGTGGSVGPNLLNRVPNHDTESLALTLLTGKGGMPSWAHFENQEVADLSAFLFEQYGALAP